MLLISALFIVFLTKHAYSQAFFNNGYVILTSGDTLNGEIRERSTQVIDFRTVSANQIQTYTTGQLTGYRVEGGNRLAIRFAENGQETAYFMREQIKGYISLYSLFKPEGRLTHAIRLPDKTFVPLRGNLALLVLTKHLTECTDPKFTRLLNSQSSPLSNTQFERLIYTYNAYVNPAQSVRKIKKPFYYEAGLSIGAVQNSWKYYSPKDIFWDPNGVYGPNYTAAFGGFFTIIPRKRLSLSVEILFTQFHGSRMIALNNPVDPTVQKSRLYSFSESYFAFPITGRYMLNNDSIRWYLKGGIVPTLGTVVKGSIVGTNIVYADIPFRAGIGVGYLAGLGADIRLGQKRHLYIEARTMPHLVNDGISHVANSRSLQLIMNVPLIQH